MLNSSSQDKTRHSQCREERADYPKPHAEFIVGRVYTNRPVGKTPKPAEKLRALRPLGTPTRIRKFNSRMPAGIRSAVAAFAALVLALVLLSSCSQQSTAQTATLSDAADPDRTASEPARELLNSERIEERFGSYGVEVLESDATVRVSNLYSGAGERRVSRTFAVVFYPEQIDPLFAAEHAQILGGGSIGAVFAANGWTVTKRNRHIGEIESTDKVAALMQDRARRPLAVHVYVLNVSKDNDAFDYATIAEVHHPDYLRLRDVETLYGQPEPANEAADAQLHRIMEITAERMR